MDDIRSLSGPAFFKMAFRLGAYEGVIRARLLAEEQEHGQQAPASAQQHGWGQARQEVNPGTRESLEAMQADLQRQAPGAPQLFSFGTFQRAG